MGLVGTTGQCLYVVEPFGDGWRYLVLDPRPGRGIPNGSSIDPLMCVETLGSG